MSFGNKVASSTGFSLSNVTRNVFCSLYTMEQNIIWCRIWTPRLKRFHLVRSLDTKYYEFPIMVFVPFTGIYCTSRDRELNADKLWCTTAVIYFKNAQFAIRPQFYIQLLYRPHLGTWILPFGQFRQNKKISETTEFLLKYATFWGGFFNFL